MKKRLKIDNNLYENLSLEEILKRYEPFLSKKAYSFSIYGKSKYPLFHYYYDYEDVYQQCCIGFLKAYDNYNLDRDLLFYTYMLNMVDGEVLRYIRDSAKARRMDNANDFEHCSLDFTISQDGNKDTALGDIIEDISFDINNIVSEIDLKDMLSILTEQEREIIKLRFFDGKSQWDIAHMYGKNQVWISRQETKILNKIRKNEKLKEAKSFAKQEEINNMAKLKINVDDLEKYLLENANKEVSISSVMNDYAKKKGYSISTVFTAITKKKPERYEELKAMYKDTGKVAPSKVKKGIVTQPAIIKPLSEQTNSIMPKMEEPFADKKPTVMVGHMHPIASNNIVNPFKGLTIKEMKLEFDDFNAIIINNKVKLELPVYDENDLDLYELEEEHLEQIKVDIDKILQVLKAVK